MTVRRRARKILIAERWRDRRIHIPILELKGRVPIEAQHDGGEQRAAGTQIEMRSRFFVVGNPLRANCPGPDGRLRDPRCDRRRSGLRASRSGATNAPAPEIKDPR